MTKKTVEAAPQCSVDYAFQRVGGKHKGRLIWHLQDGPVRYGQLRRLIAGVSPKMLTQALRELEEDGLVTRHIFVEVPPRVEYALTDNGAQLLPFIGLLKEWGEQQMQAAGVRSVHEELTA
ncbi:winged helix-turn-helix transcriptional regulator [Hymenobacter terrenus]|uniref:winged helix-turn-helix transcriptional regulator n=1 Tax=Hymenobacter terrenus TaxID=1629124 RepID=UPI0006194402|nr:helix-turn-helix domain-containing protein [Hymenobacter terrenus]